MRKYFTLWTKQEFKGTQNTRAHDEQEVAKVCLFPEVLLEKTYSSMEKTK